MIDLSVVIPLYNAMPLIERTLESVFSQKTHYSYEIIIVDDGSRDKSLQFVRDYVASKGYGESVIILSQENAGPAAARNNGIAHAHGRYSAFLDSDDFWINGFIEKSISFLDSNPDCVAVNVGQKHLTVSGDNFSPKCLDSYDEPFVLDDFWTFWGEYMHVCTGSACIKTDIIRQIGGQRTDLRVTEDLEFWAMVSTYGKWGVIPELLFVSDGTELVKDQQTWIRKMQPRWQSAPSVDEWQKRIIERLGFREDTLLPQGYQKARGRIASMLVYSQIMSGRLCLSREETLRYGKFFPSGILSQLMMFCSHSSLVWRGLCKYIQYREFHRF
jgi:glycosyltransferase involved in cell wall biosynthesis